MGYDIASDLAVSSVHSGNRYRRFSKLIFNPKNEITNAILAANNFGYAYDPIGNRISTEDSEGNKVYSANQLNQYTSITNGGLRTLGYDLDGNLTRSVTLSGVEWVTNDFTWDAENRLTGVISNGTVIASFKYDYMSRRYEKATAAGTNTFVWDGWLPVCELSNPTIGNSTTNFYVWGLDLSQSLQGAGGIGGLLSVTKSDEVYFPCADGNGNITDYVTADGAVVAHREFDAYGNTIAASGAVTDFHFWFSTKHLDSETGLYYYGYRYYQPSAGRWVNRDPIEEELQALSVKLAQLIEKLDRDEDAENEIDAILARSELQRVLYPFCANNPINSFDPAGQWNWLTFVGCFAGLSESELSALRGNVSKDILKRPEAAKEVTELLEKEKAAAGKAWNRAMKRKVLREIQEKVVEKTVSKMGRQAFLKWVASEGIGRAIPVLGQALLAWDLCKILWCAGIAL